MKKLFYVLVIGVAGITATSCSKDSGKSDEVVQAVSPDMTDVDNLDNIIAGEDTKTEEVTVKPKNFVGKWHDTSGENCSMEVSNENKGYKIIIDWKREKKSEVVWELKGEYDNTSGSIAYVGSRTEKNTLSDGKQSEKCTYKDGTGLIYIGSDDMIHWVDDVENEGADYIFARD